MSTVRSHRSGNYLRALPVAAALLIIVHILAGCREDEKEMMAGRVDPESTPTMTTTDVVTLISDSGITRYRIITPLWLMYEEAQEPKWRFPSGLKLEKFDPQFKVDASIECDSATYFKDKQLWRLDGYVDVKNLQGEKFLTEQLFWNQRTQKIYSDSFIHIERSGRVIEGYGFESNETMTDYHVLRVSGIFPSSQFKTDSAARERAAADTVAPESTPAMPEPSLRHSNHVVQPANAPLRRLDGPNIIRGQRPNQRLEPVNVSEDSPNSLIKKKR